MFGRKQRRHSIIDTLVGPNSRITGDLFFAGGCHIDGTVKGNVSDNEQQGAKDGRNDGSDSHYREQALLHQGETLPAQQIGRLDVINEQPRQIEEAREPGHHKCQMEGLEPEKKGPELHRRTVTANQGLGYIWPELKSNSC